MFCEILLGKRVKKLFHKNTSLAQINGLVKKIPYMKIKEIINEMLFLLPSSRLNIEQVSSSLSTINELSEEIQTKCERQDEKEV